MSRRVIFDTSIMIASEKGKVDLRSIIGDDDPAIAAITAMELLIGMEGSDGQQRDDRALLVEDYCASFPIEPYNLEVARMHALLYHRARRIGRPRSAHDLIIAATAGATGRTLLTADAKAGFAELPGVKAEVVKIP